MAWDSKYVNFGVLKIEGRNVKVYESRYNYVTVNVGQPVNDARWAGGELNIYLADGKVRRYRDRYNYITV